MEFLLLPSLPKARWHPLSGWIGRTAWYALGMTINALHRMDVVLAGFLLEGGIHGLHGDAAVGKSWMTGTAGWSSLLAMFQMTGQAAQTFMYTDGSTIVARIDLSSWLEVHGIDSKAPDAGRGLFSPDVPLQILLAEEAPDGHMSEFTPVK